MKALYDLQIDDRKKQLRKMETLRDVSEGIDYDAFYWIIPSGFSSITLTIRPTKGTFSEDESRTLRHLLDQSFKFPDSWERKHYSFEETNNWTKCLTIEGIAVRLNIEDVALLPNCRLIKKQVTHTEYEIKCNGKEDNDEG